MSLSIFSALNQPAQQIPAIIGGLTGKLLGLIPVDLNVRERHIGRSEPTRHALESGEEITDHVINYPDRLEVDIYVSNQDYAGVSYGLRAAVTLSIINTLRENKLRMSVLVRHRLYNNMVIVMSDISHEPGAYGALRGTVAFQQINEADPLAIRINSLKLSDPNIAAKAIAPVESGEKIAGKTSDAVASIAKQLFN